MEVNDAGIIATAKLGDERKCELSVESLSTTKQLFWFLHNIALKLPQQQQNIKRYGHHDNKGNKATVILSFVARC